jgi:hypothetical protein
VHLAAIVGTNIFFKGVVTAFFAFAKKPNHYFSLLKEPEPLAFVTLMTTAWLTF